MRLRRWLIGIGVGVFTALTGIFAMTDLGQMLEKNLGLPWLFQVRGAIEAPRDIVVVAINAKTAKWLGLPPLPRDWPRSIHARLIEALVERGASVIVFDLKLDTPRSLEDDLEFAKAVANSDRVVLFEWLDGMNEPIFDDAGKEVAFVWREHRIGPIQPLAEAAKAIAAFTLPKDKIAVDTFWAFKDSSGAHTIPAVALQLHALGTYDKWSDLLEQARAPGARDRPRRREELARTSEVRGLMDSLRGAFIEDPGLAARLSQLLDGSEGSGLDDKDRRLFKALINLYQGGDQRFLNFYGPPGSITNIPYHAFLTDDDPRFDDGDLDLTDKVVFVGYSDLFDPGQPDRYETVFTQFVGQGSVDLSGVEIMATAFGNLLTDRSLRPGGVTLTAGIVLLFGLLVGALSYIPPAMVAAPLTFGAGILYGVGTQFAFNQAELWLPLVTPMLIQLPAALFVGLGGHYWFEHRQRMKVSAALNYYLPKSIAQNLTETGVDPATLNRVVDGTCLATDMSGFTSIAETMRPRDLARFMNDYFDTLATPIKEQFVDVTEFHADSIMCAWTEPDGFDGNGTAGAVGRHQAVFAALGVVEAVHAFTEKHAQFRLNARIGLEAGRVFLGHTGGGGQLAFSILGDCANTASRLEGLNKHIGTRVLATEAVVAGLEDILFRPLGLFRFVGKAESRPVVEILAKTADAEESQRRLCARFEEALDVFRAQKWANASAAFGAVLRDDPDDGPSKFYLERCRRYQVEPPDPEQAPVIRMTSK